MTNLTTLELKVLQAMTKDDFYEMGLDSELWADVFVDTCYYTQNIKPKEVRGVFSSLVKKNIFRPIAKGRDGSISLTENGKEVMRELGYE